MNKRGIAYVIQFDTDGIEKGNFIEIKDNETGTVTTGIVKSATANIVKYVSADGHAQIKKNELTDNGGTKDVTFTGELSAKKEVVAESEDEGEL